MCRNLPLTAIVAVIATLYVKLPTPPGTYREKAKQLNLLGNFFFIIGITLFTTGLTYGGNTYPWTDVKVCCGRSSTSIESTSIDVQALARLTIHSQVLAPLLIGVLLLFTWVALERYYVKYPTVPFEILFGNKTTVLGYLGTFIHGISGPKIYHKDCRSSDGSSATVQVKATKIRLGNKN